MPTYEYGCRSCGPFDALRAMAERDAPCACPACGAPSERVLFTPAALSRLPADVKAAHAVNERSAHSPRCGCSAHSGKRDSAPRSFAGRRPWMISH
jgi:putative FmdB family regulatory protein